MADVKKRSLLWDIFKGFGISFIVFGHTGKTGGAIVYLFHLALFFFVTGYFFNEERYGDKPFTYFGHRLGGSWPRYMLYCIFFAVTHNYCVIHGLMPEGAVIYGEAEFLNSILNSMVFERPELYAGPMWFVPLWLLGGALFAGVVYVAGVLGKGDRNTNFWCTKNKIITVLSIACIIIGLYAVDKSIMITYHMELAFVIEPFFALGYFMHKYLGDWQEKMPWFFMIPIAAFIFYLFTRFIAAGIWFDLASQYIFGLWYYVGGVLGIIFTILISKLLERLCSTAARLMALIGRYSFDIMALHIFVFKMMDMLLRKLYYRDPGMDISAYPSPLSQKWWILYLVIAVVLPLIAGIILDRIGGFIKNIIYKKIVYKKDNL